MRLIQSEATGEHQQTQRKAATKREYHSKLRLNVAQVKARTPEPRTHKHSYSALHIGNEK